MLHDNEDIKMRDASFFVFRGSYDRLVSTFINKFVFSSWHPDIFANYKRQMGSTPVGATLRAFVTNYCHDFGARAVHVVPQKRHLMPAYYDQAIIPPRVTLYADEMFGDADAVAAKFFRSRVNAAKYASTSNDEGGLVHCEAPELRERYLADGVAPPNESFFNNDLLTNVKQAYQEDYLMIENIYGAQQRPEVDRG